MSKNVSLSFFFFILLLGIPFAAHAATASFFGPIVSDACYCLKGSTAALASTNSAPAWGCILATFQNVINFVIALSTIIITIFIAWAGFTYMTSGGNPERRSLANKRILNAVIGLIIVLCAWLLVNSLLLVIYNPSATGFAPWNSILSGTPAQDCLTPVNPPSSPPPLLGATNPTGGAAPPAAASTPATTGNSGMNVAAAVAYLQSHALSSSSGKCATYVRQAIAAGGLSSFNSGQGDAYQYGPILSSAGFTTVYSGTYSSASETAEAWQAGDVVVFQPVNGHQYGHIAMYTGSQWISDYAQPRMSSNAADYQGGSFTVYGP